MNKMMTVFETAPIHQATPLWGALWLLKERRDIKMKMLNMRHCIVLLLCISLFILFTIQTMANINGDTGLEINSIVEFQDNQLKAAVERTLGKADPNVQDMLLLEELDVSYESIKTLHGLENALNLKNLDVSYNNILSLKPIRNLESLVELNISGCKLKDMSCVSSLKNLTRLWAKNCELTNISFLHSISGLFHLDLSGNQLSDLKPLSSIDQLGILYLSNNNLSDISCLSNLRNLSELALDDNQIKDITVLSNLSSLEYLNLYNNDIRDISSLKNFSKLCTLSLSENPLNRNSINQVLPVIWNKNQDNLIDIWFDQEQYCPDKDIFDTSLLFSEVAELSPDEKYLLFAAGPQGNALPGLAVGGRIFILSLEESDQAKLFLVPDVVSDLKGGTMGSLGWRNENEFHILTDMGSASDQLYVYSVQKERDQLEINKQYTLGDSGFILGAKWGPSGQFLFGLTFGTKKKTALFDYQQKIVRKYEMPFSSQYFWMNEKTLLFCKNNLVIYAIIEGIAETEQAILAEAQGTVCLGGMVIDKPVYAVDEKIYWGENSFYNAAEDIQELFVGQTQVAFVCEDIICVVDLVGKEIFRKPLTDKEQVLAFSEKKSVLYLLAHNKTRIESCDILNNGKMSTLCSIEEIKGVLRQ